MGIQSFRSINSGKPFQNTAVEYLEKGWQPIPLPPREKFPPPTGFTGRSATQVTTQQITDWVGDPGFQPSSNIGIHLDSVTILDDESGEDKEFDVIGIDVDISDDKYDSSGTVVKKGKSGGDTIAEMAGRLGELPETFMSTAHGPGAEAGIRLYLVPAGLKWPGKIGNSVDCIQKAHRYAVVSPSWHPTAGQYAWFRTSDNANVSGEPCEIPDVAALPELPEEWVAELTSGIKDTSGPADQDSTVDEIEKWFRRTTAKGDLCKYMEKQLSKAKDAFQHDIHSALRDMQRSIVAGGIEGHPGAVKALNRLKKSARRANRERVATNAEGGLDNGQGGKMTLAVRNDDEFEGEWKRSLWGAIRMVKGEVDEGVKVPQKTCSCVTADLSELQGRFGVNPKKEFDPGDYRYTDDGNAEMFKALWGDVVRYIEELDVWLVLHENRWRPDTDMEVFRMFHGIRDTWLEQERALWKVAAGLPNGDEKKAAQGRARECRKHADNCGSAHAAPRCLTSLSRYEGVALKANLIDSDPRLLGCVNGALELNEDGTVDLRDYDPQEFVTKSTAVPYIPFSEMVKEYEAGEGEYVRGMELMEDYFSKFIPEPEDRIFVQKILASALFGRNDSKLMFFFNGPGNTGKSTLVNLLTAAMGSYGTPGGLEIFNPQSGDRNPGLMSVLGTRIVNMAEMGSSTTVMSDVLKKLASGDIISARDNYGKSKDIVKFKPSMTFICPANGVPYVEHPDEATGNRVCCVPFEQKISSEHRIAGRAAEMEAMCQEVILSWAVDGWAAYCAEGLDEPTDWPANIQRATEAFIRAMSPTGEFEKDLLEVSDDPEDFIPKEFLYRVYTQWSRDAAEKMPIPKTKFMSMMKERATETRKSFGYHRDRQLKLLGFSGVRFVRLAEIQENQNTINHEVQALKNKIDGQKPVSFKTKSK